MVAYAIILALGRLRQKDLGFKASLSCRAKLGLVWVTGDLELKKLT